MIEESYREVLERVRRAGGAEPLVRGQHYQEVRLKILRFRAVQERTGLSRTTIWRQEAAGLFSRRVRLTSGSVGWHEHEVDAWIAERQRGAGIVPTVHQRDRAA